MLYLNQSDLQRWLKAITTQPKDPSQFLSWVEGPLREFFPFSKMFMAYGELIAGQIKTEHWLASGYESKFLQQLVTTFELEHRGSMQWWFQNRQPFSIDPNSPPPFASAFEIEEIRKFDLGNVAAHGVLNCRSTAGTYFSFAGVTEPLSGWHLEALQLITPVLNDLYLAHVAIQIAKPPKAVARLTVRQKDIVRLVASGQDDKTVARQLGITEKTVRNQLTEVYAQLGISKRSQLLPLLR